jgi:hypothetical protein
MVASHVMGVPAEGLALSAQLASRYFRPGGVVRGVIQLSTSQKAADAASEVAYVVAQIHGHVTVDSNLLTLPVVHAHSPRAASSTERAHLERKMSGEVFMFDKMGAALPDVRSFSGDTGTCIYQSAPSVLLSDLNVAPTPEELQAGEVGTSERDKRCSREFAIALPDDICPTFRGNSARVFYAVSITAQSALPGSKPVSLHLSFEVYASEYLFAASTIASADQIAAQKTDKQSEEAQPAPVVEAPRSGRRMERSTSFAPAPVSVRKGSEIAFELRPALMHGRVETDLMQRAQTSIFTIGKDTSHLVRFLLTKQFYQPGEILLGVFDFTRASIPCYEITATLCLEEKLASMSLDPDRVIQSKVVGSYQEYTHGALQTNLRLCIPQDAVPTIRTDLVSFQWLLRFEFCAGLPADAGSSDKSLQRQKFQWQVPVAVKPPVALERAALANVPRKLFSGSFRAASLSSA